METVAGASRDFADCLEWQVAPASAVPWMARLEPSAMDGSKKIGRTYGHGKR